MPLYNPVTSVELDLASPGTIGDETPGLAFFTALTSDSVSADTVTAKAAVNRTTASTYTAALADTAAIRELSDPSGVLVTLPNDSPQGTSITWCQIGAGPITFEADTGATLNSRDGATISGGQYALMTTYVSTNGSGTNAAWILGGDITS